MDQHADSKLHVADPDSNNKTTVQNITIALDHIEPIFLFKFYGKGRFKKPMDQHADSKLHVADQDSNNRTTVQNITTTLDQILTKKSY